MKHMKLDYDYGSSKIMIFNEEYYNLTNEEIDEMHTKIVESNLNSVMCLLKYTKNNKSNSGNGGLYYLNPKTGIKCIVGACLTEESLVAWASLEHHICSPFVGMIKLRKPTFKTPYAYTTYDLWRQLQIVHDCSINWDDNGLSETGEIEFIRLYDEFCK